MLNLPERTFPDGVYATLFFNLHNYVELQEALGPGICIHAQGFILLVQQIIFEYGGAQGEIFGTGQWGYFPSAEKALEASFEIHNHLKKAHAENPDLPRIHLTVSGVNGHLSFQRILNRQVQRGHSFPLSKEIGYSLNEYGLGILLAESFLTALPEISKQDLEYRWVDQISTSNEKVEKVYEVYGHEIKSTRDFKRKSEWMLGEALELYFSKNVSGALACFENLFAEQDAEDEAIPFLRIYRNRCLDMLQPGPNPYEPDILDHWRRAGVSP